MRIALFAASCVVLALAGCGTTAPAPAEPEATASPVRGATQEVPDDWRWETYGRVQLAVPGEWGYGTTERQWCTRSKKEKPFVGRPGALTMVGCSGTGGTEGQAEDFSLSKGGQFVWFGVSDRNRTSASEQEQLTSWVTTGDRITFEMAGERVAIQAPQALREQILDTVRLTENDQNGCPIEAPFAGDPDWRPSGPAVTELGKVKSVSACRYGGAQLGSSIKVKGKKAARAIKAIAEAPKGGGPKTPAANCMQPEDLVAMDQIVLLVEADKQGTIGLRWDGCLHRGLDDGTAVRQLTRPAVRPFVTGPNRISAWTGGARLARIHQP
ncbi:hypothetical protein [Kineosporia babensis]|uniref:Secreted protein n=1 Tax=Kineosporia babensis TaxID=499548 RepID=A0A9X1NMU5_9ACTN|nr:hypothetical protein [Kineosporia babensis]MCD5315993.1 hypothetical protein [Kineosporia babensis]